MSMGEFLSIQPSELKFPFELKKQSSCTMQLANKTDQYIAFKVKTTNPKKYCVRPNSGVVSPNSIRNIKVTMQAQGKAPPDMQCNDKFLVQSVVARNGSTDKDVTRDMYNKEDGKLVNEFKFRAAYIPANTLSPGPEGDNGRTFLKTSSADNANDLMDMINGDFLSMQPSELKFPFELRKQSSCSMQLVNKTNQYIAFKVKTTNPKKYCVRPNGGVVLPNSICNITVTMQAQRKAPPDMKCNDKFLVQSVIAPKGSTNKDVTRDMFGKEDGKLVNELIFRVAYVPANTPSPVHDGDKEGSYPKTCSVDNAIRTSIVSHAFQVVRSLKQSLQNLLSFEVQIISRLKHPKGCPEDLALKYGYHPNGSLEDPLLLLRKDNSSSQYY